jgi:hypothetical protein
MPTRQTITGIELGQFGRLLYTDVPRGKVLRANDTCAYPGEKIIVVVVI